MPPIAWARGAGRGSAVVQAGDLIGLARPHRPTADPAAGLQVLVERFRNESGGRTVVGTLPVRVTFPELGPSIFLAAELTAEARAPSFEVAFRRTRD